jgi:hypothetical protein
LLNNITTANFNLTQIGGGAGTTTLDFTNSTGLANVSANTAGAAFTINNLAASLSNIAISNSAFAHTFQFADAALSGASDVVTIAANNLTGAVAVNLNTVTAGANAYETVNISSVGNTTNVFNVASNGVGYTTLNVSGGTALTTVNQSANLTVFNAANASGVVTYTANGEGVASYTGGTANDVFILDGTYTAADTVNGGAGTADRLVLTNAIATAVVTAQANISNTEVISVSNALNGAVSVNLFGGATGYRFGANSGAAPVINYASGTNSLDFQNFTLGGGLVVNVAGVATTDVLTTTIGSTAAGVTLGNSVTTNGVETLNLLSQGGANQFTTLTLTDTAATETVSITGTQNVTFTGAVSADAVNASGMTGAGTLNMTGGAARATIITGTANNDVLAGSAAGDIISGGAGDDVISNQIAGTTRASAGDILSGAAGQDTFNLFGSNASGAYATLIGTTSRVADFTFSATAAATDIIGLSDTVANYTAFGAALDIIVGGVAAAGATVVQSLAQNTTAATTTANLLKLTTGVVTTGLTVQQIFDSAIGTGTITGLTDNDGQFVTVYDTTNSQAVVMLASTGANGVLETADIVQLVGTIAMSAADYAAFNNTAVLMNA